MAIQKRKPDRAKPANQAPEEDVNAALGLTEETGITKVDPSNLPSVASLQPSQVTKLIQQVEAMQAGEAEQDERLIDFLAALHQRQRELIDFTRNAQNALAVGNSELIASVNALSNTFYNSLEGIQETSKTLSEVAGGSQLGATFRQRSGIFARFDRLIATQSRAEAQEPAA